MNIRPLLSLVCRRFFGDFTGTKCTSNISKEFNGKSLTGRSNEMFESFYEKDSLFCCCTLVVIWRTTTVTTTQNQQTDTRVSAFLSLNQKLHRTLVDNPNVK